MMFIKRMFPTPMDSLIYKMDVLLVTSIAVSTRAIASRRALRLEEGEGS
jgi:hypothetical protein